MATQNPYCIVGLGNPGQPYVGTRHNVGFDWVERVSEQYHASAFLPEHKFLSLISKTIIDERLCYLSLPQTFMNNSGKAVAALLHYYKIPPAHLLVVHDELDLKPGTIKLKWDGGHGGHNGLRDIIAALGTTEFLRLRIGVGKPNKTQTWVDYVLSRASREEQILIDESMEKALTLIPYLMREEREKAMQLLHTSSQ